MDEYRVTDARGSVTVFRSLKNAQAFSNFIRARYKDRPVLLGPDGREWDFAADDWAP